MVLSKRERYIALATAAAVGLLVFDHFVLTPLMEARKDLDNRITARQADQADNRRKIQQARANRERWREMQSSGLRRRDAAEAESETMKEIRNWAQQAGFGLSLLKADRSEKEKEFQKSIIRVTGTGGMEQVARFVWSIQTASIPIQFSEFQLTTHKEGTNDLTLQLGLSTIYLLPNSPVVEQPTTAPRNREVPE